MQISLRREWSKSRSSGSNKGDIARLMKVMIVPMAAMAETHGPVSRCRALAYGLKEAGFDVCTCMAKDVNYRAMDDIPNFDLDIPMPLGLPKAIATKTFPVAQRLGITSKKTVNSFDQVLFLTGNLDYKYLKKSVSSVRKAIQEDQPDIVYSEFNISAIIAAKKEGVSLYLTVSYPTQYAYACDSKLGRGLNKLLKELGLPRVEPPVGLFDWADQYFCMSIRELEPIDKPNVIYCGSLKSVVTNPPTTGKRNKIVVYMGNGTVSAKKMLSVITGAFTGSIYEVYVASAYLKEGSFGNIHVAPRWDFGRLLEEAVVFINHGGQNSIVDGLIHGVPQIVVPGKVFERRFNSKCLVDNQAGIAIEPQSFRAEDIREAVKSILEKPEIVDHAIMLGRKLSEAGGIQTVIKGIKELGIR